MEAAVAEAGEFHAFYAAVFGRLVGQLHLVTGDVHEAEDVVQEALTRASVRWSRIAGYDQPEAWVRRVAMNPAATRARSLQRRARALLRMGPPPYAVAASVDAVALASALRQLPLRHRQAVVLHYLVGMSVEETGLTLGVPGGTVKGWLARARRALTSQLDGGRCRYGMDKRRSRIQELAQELAEAASRQALLTAHRPHAAMLDGTGASRRWQRGLQAACARPDPATGG
jgi:RNA polymerase sigma-70 factor, ECF subfamily